MKVLIVGSGCREHALAWKLAQSDKVEKVYVAPGNGGTALEEKCENLSPEAGDPASKEGQKELLDFALKENIELTLIGPELPLAEGIVDCFRAEGLCIVGPDKRAARLEASKIYAKAFMKKYGVRTAKSRNFTGPDKALEYARKHFGGSGTKKSPGTDGAAKTGAQKTPAGRPLVVKADGLAAGKGVVVAGNLKEAEEVILSFMKNKSLGEAGASLVLEEFLEGKEVSILAAVSVKSKRGTLLPFIPARDHKRRFEGGRGPNTGGMGAIAPVPDFTKAAEADFKKHILEPTIRGIKAENLDYRGFIFFGLMVKDEECYLLEYNVRLGDPETEALLPLMESDLADLSAAVLKGKLESFRLEWKKGAACVPLAVAEGYPGPYRRGDPIALNETAFDKSGARLFIGGAARGAGGPSGSGLRTAGGRVLALAAVGKDAEDAREKAYRAMGAVSFKGMGFRRDIGKEGVS
jgi:phosphoribosylamine--glycine ligase